MKNVLVAGLLLAMSFGAVAQTSDNYMRQLPDGRTQIVTPVIERQCEYTNKANLGNAAIGAGVGYATGEIASRAISAGSRGRSSTGSLIGLVAGAIIGANTQQEQVCRYVDMVTGYRVVTFDKHGRPSEVIVPAKKHLTLAQ